MSAFGEGRYPPTESEIFAFPVNYDAKDGTFCEFGNAPFHPSER